MRLVLVDNTGAAPSGGIDASHINPRVGVTTDGRLLTTTTFAPPSPSAGAVLSWDDFQVTVDSTAAPLSATSKPCHIAILTAPVTNTDVVNFGPNSTCRHMLLVGQSYMLPVVTGGMFDLADWYVKGTSGDKVTVLFVA